MLWAQINGHFSASFRNSVTTSTNGLPSLSACSVVIPWIATVSVGMSQPCGRIISCRSVSPKAHAIVTGRGNRKKSSSHFIPFSGTPVVSQSKQQTSFKLNFSIALIYLYNLNCPSSVLSTYFARVTHEQPQTIHLIRLNPCGVYRYSIIRHERNGYSFGCLLHLQNMLILSGVNVRFSVYLTNICL